MSVQDWSRRVVFVCCLLCLAPTSLPAEELNHPLFRAIRSGDLQLLGSLLRQGAPANLQTSLIEII